jgi:hypothetical protein
MAMVVMYEQSIDEELESDVQIFVGFCNNTVHMPN